MDQAVLAVSLLAGLEGVVMVIVLVILRRVMHSEACISAVNGHVQRHEKQLKQLHRESTSDITTFAVLRDDLGQLTDYVYDELAERIEEVDLELQANLGTLDEDDDDDDEESKPTQVQTRTSRGVRGPGRGQPHPATRRRRV